MKRIHTQLNRNLGKIVKFQHMIKCELRVFDKDAFKTEITEEHELQRLFSGTEYQRVYLHSSGKRLDFMSSPEDTKAECSLFLTDKIHAKYDESKKYDTQRVRLSKRLL